MSTTEKYDKESNPVARGVRRHQILKSGDNTTRSNCGWYWPLKFFKKDSLLIFKASFYDEIEFDMTIGITVIDYCMMTNKCTVSGNM